MGHSGERTSGQRHGQLELELLSMAAEGEEGTERRGEEWLAGMDRAVLGEVIPARASAKRRPGRQGAAWRRRASRRPPPAPTGEEEDDRGAGPGLR